MQVCDLLSSRRYDTHIEVCRSASAALAVIFPHQNKREMAIYDKFRDSVREEVLDSG